MRFRAAPMRVALMRGHMGAARGLTRRGVAAQIVNAPLDAVQTTAEVVPGAGLILDPITGYFIDPITGLVIDPLTGLIPF